MSADAPIVTGTDFVFLPTKDFAAAERFYGDVLGLPCSARYDRIPGGEFETGNLTLQVIEAAAIGRESGQTKELSRSTSTTSTPRGRSSSLAA